MVRDIKLEEKLNRNKRVYLASPFFNEEQVRRVNVVRDTLLADGGIDVYSPMHDSKFKLSSKPNISEAKLVFDDNVNNILKADVVVAILDGCDVGTYFEIGVANSKGIKVISLIFDKNELQNDPRNSFRSYLDLNVVSHMDGESYITENLASAVHASSYRSVRVLYIEPSDPSNAKDGKFEDKLEFHRLCKERGFTDKAILQDSFSFRAVPDMMKEIDYVILSRKGRYTSPAVIWGAAYLLDRPVIALGKESSSNLMLQPSTTYCADTMQDAINFIDSTQHMSYLDIIQKYRGNGLLGSEGVI